MESLDSIHPSFCVVSSKYLSHNFIYDCKLIICGVALICNRFWDSQSLRFWKLHQINFGSQLPPRTVLFLEYFAHAQCLFIKRNEISIEIIFCFYILFVFLYFLQLRYLRLPIKVQIVLNLYSRCLGKL